MAINKLKIDLTQWIVGQLTSLFFISIFLYAIYPAPFLTGFIAGSYVMGFLITAFLWQGKRNGVEIK